MEKKEAIYIMFRDLDTRDKRFMFLKIKFAYALPNINLEGSPKECASRIWQYFDKNETSGDLLTELDRVFNQQ